MGVGCSSSDEHALSRDRQPDFATVVIDERKLRDYCLDPAHVRGRHKAKVFRAALGIEQGDAPWLANAISTALRNAQATVEGQDRFGTRWRTDLSLDRSGRTAEIRAIWIVTPDDATPRLVTCYVLPRREKGSTDA